MGDIDRNWAILAPFQGAEVKPPALFIAGTRDAVIASPMGRGALENQLPLQCSSAHRFSGEAGPE